MSPLVVIPERPLTGATIRLEGKSSLLKENEAAIIRPIHALGARDFAVRRAFRGEGMDRFLFSIALPGRYQAVVGSEKLEFEVESATEMGFGLEFGLTAIFILIGFGGTVLWAKRRKMRIKREGMSS